MIQASSRCRGFTFIELAMIMVIMGILIVAGMRFWDGYLNDRYAHETYDKIRVLDSALAYFIGTQGRLPCPSNPTIPVTDPNAGREIPLASCQALIASATPVGTCLDGVCKVDGARDTDADGDIANDPVLVGGLPFIPLQAGGQNVAQGATLYGSVDSWNFQFTYAVSGYLTDAGTYRASRGVIDVRTEPSAAFPRTGTATIAQLGGQPLVDPAGSAQYVIIGHGPNHVGAYSASGHIAWPCGGTQDSDNCDNNPVTSNFASFTGGVRVDKPGATQYDDYITYNSYSLSSLWDFVGSTGDIHNLNPGYVGVGTGNPTQQLDVIGGLMQTNMKSLNICDQANAALCWSPDFISAPAASNATLYCPASVNPLMFNVVTGVTFVPGSPGPPVVPPHPQATCALVPKVLAAKNQFCGIDPVTGGQQYVSGFDSSGNVICFTP